MTRKDRIVVWVHRHWRTSIQTLAEEYANRFQFKFAMTDAIEHILRSFFVHNKRINDGPDPAKYNFVWVTNREGLCIYLGELWYVLTGGTPETDLGLGCENRIHPDDYVQASQTYRIAHRLRCAFFCAYRLRTRSGNYVQMRSHGTPAYENGLFVGFVGSATIITSDQPVIRANTAMTIGVELPQE